MEFGGAVFLLFIGFLFGVFTEAKTGLVGKIGEKLKGK